MSHIWIMIAKRLALGLLTLFIVSLLIFLATELLPGDFAEEFLGQAATPETVAPSGANSASICPCTRATSNG